LDNGQFRYHTALNHLNTGQVWYIGDPNTSPSVNKTIQIKD
jgi:hypothetical protein